MDDNSTGCHNTIGSSSASSAPSLLDSTMPPMLNDNVECVGVGVGSTGTIGSPNPSSALPHKPKKFDCHPRSRGTSSMLQHIRKSCKKYPGRLDKSRTKLSFEAKREGQGVVGEGTYGNLVFTKYNATKIRESTSQMIIVDELPFRFVEGEGLQNFMKTVEPRYSIPSRYTMMRDWVRLYMSKKEKLRAMFLTSDIRVCLTTDSWTSVQNLNYMCITAHFIDNNWNLHKRILNFCLLCNHKGETIGQKIESCMLEWGISSIFTITVDNDSSNDTALEYLRKRTAHRTGAILENQFMDVKCCAYILNLIVSDSLKEVDESIVKSAFDLLEEYDGNYVLSLTEEKNAKKGLGPSNYDDWDRIRTFLKFLKLFYDATLRLSRSLYVTSNMYWQEIRGIQMHIQSYCDSSDYVLSSMAERMMMKYNKYWGDLDKVNVFMFVDVILDPQTKLGSLEFWFKNILNEEQCTNMVKKLKHYLQKLYDHLDAGETSSQVEHGSVYVCPQGSSMIEETDNLSLHFMNKFHKYLILKSDVHNKLEIDRYLMEDVEKPNVNFDILNWWKVNSSKFLVLAKNSTYCVGHSHYYSCFRVGV
ncbi:zinc finger BED domain-containing protein RICESLEEPER 1-like [Alnus glutinosa]|uniref:zinc finger BED domain-containing protein RICESLEEPER 1-like n=1 Tax=Alnus glutinosa TaxID=3517 RepID=UPI002D7734A3|nr:zinc finger BED domain-containing protein RICESLEEPER 1-like [Alnus glutinosa]